MKEIWKDISDYEGLYQISNLGNVRSLDRYVNYKIKNKTRFLVGKLKKQSINKKGYLKVTLFKNGKGETREIQRLVAEAFIPNPNNLPQVNHKDGNKTRNIVNINDLYCDLTNLEWCTARENTIHSKKVLKKGIKKVNQYDLKGNYIKTYGSIKEASEQINISSCSISNVINGNKKSAGGFKWDLY